MKVLVTGSCGFIGTNLCERLLSEGHEVIGIDDFSGKYPKKTYFENLGALSLSNGRKFSFFGWSVLDRKKMLSLSSKGITHVVHLAARTGVRDSVENPEDYLKVNVIGALNVLDLCVAAGVKGAVFASSSSVYGKNPVPFRETMPTNSPLSPYAASKIAMEALVHSYSHVHGLNANVLRFFTVYGPRGRQDMAVFRFAKLITRGKPLTIFGDGSSKRDFTYVGDIVNGIMLALVKCNGFNVFNLGCSSPVEVRRIVSLLEENLGKKAAVVNAGANSADVDETFADISKARAELGYSPKTAIEKGIEEFVAWFNKSQ